MKVSDSETTMVEMFFTEFPAFITEFVLSFRHIHAMLIRAGFGDLALQFVVDVNNMNSEALALICTCKL